MKKKEEKRVGTTAERLAQKPYEERMCRIECYPACVSWQPSYDGPSVEEWVDFIDRIGMEVQIVNGEIDRGTPRFPSEMIPPHPDVDSDRLPRFLELAHQRGIIVLSYYPIIYTKPLKPLHPEWMMKFLDDGRPQPENLGWFCFNSPYRDWLPAYLLEWMDNLDLDGFYFDDTNYGTHEDRPWTPACCCSWCEELFRRETSLDIPRKVDFDSMVFRRFVQLALREDDRLHAQPLRQDQGKVPGRNPRPQLLHTTSDGLVRRPSPGLAAPGRGGGPLLRGDLPLPARARLRGQDAARHRNSLRHFPQRHPAPGRLRRRAASRDLSRRRRRPGSHDKRRRSLRRPLRPLLLSAGRGHGARLRRVQKAVLLRQG